MDLSFKEKKTVCNSVLWFLKYWAKRKVVIFFGTPCRKLPIGPKNMKQSRILAFSRIFRIWFRVLKGFVCAFDALWTSYRKVLKCTRSAPKNKELGKIDPGRAHLRKKNWSTWKYIHPCLKGGTWPCGTAGQIISWFYRLHCIYQITARLSCSEYYFTSFSQSFQQ